MNTGTGMSAGRLSLVLTVVLCALLAALIGGSGFIASKLVAQAQDTTHARIDAEVSADDQARYEALKTYLAENAGGIAQTKALTAGLGTYTQSSIVATLGGYATRAGVTITNFDLGTPAAGSSAGTAGGAAAGASAGSTTVNLSLNSPVAYANLIVFLRLVEQGLMPAQIVSGDINSVDGGGTVSLSELSIKVVQ